MNQNRANTSPQGWRQGQGRAVGRPSAAGEQSQGNKVNTFPQGGEQKTGAGSGEHSAARAVESQGLFGQGALLRGSGWKARSIAGQLRDDFDGVAMLAGGHPRGDSFSCSLQSAAPAGAAPRGAARAGGGQGQRRDRAVGRPSAAGDQGQDNKANTFPQGEHQGTKERKGEGRGRKADLPPQGWGQGRTRGRSGRCRLAAVRLGVHPKREVFSYSSLPSAAAAPAPRGAAHLGPGAGSPLRKGSGSSAFLTCLGLVLALVLIPQRSWAFIDLGQGDWLSGQNELMAQLLATELDELTNVTSILSNMRSVVQAGNEALAVARQSYRAYQAVRNYSLEDLSRDAKAGLYQAFPDLAKMEHDIYLMGEQGKEIDGGHFFSYWNSYDHKMAKVVERVLTHTYKATIWPMVFPEAMTYRQNPSPVDIKIWGLYRKSGMQMEVAVQNTALATLAQKVANLVADAEESGNLELMAQATAAQSAHQQLVNSTEFLNLYKAELAAREQARDTSGRRSRALAEGMQVNMERILRPGGGMLEE